MKKKVLVFGSFVVDLMGRTPHLPAPGETVKAVSYTHLHEGIGTEIHFVLRKYQEVIQDEQNINH